VSRVVPTNARAAAAARRTYAIRGVRSWRGRAVRARHGRSARGRRCQGERSELRAEILWEFRAAPLAESAGTGADLRYDSLEGAGAPGARN